MRFCNSFSAPRLSDCFALSIQMDFRRDSDLQFQQAHLRALIRAGELVPLLLERDDKLTVVPATEEWQVGDRLIYLLHDPRPKLLRQLAGGNNQSTLVLEKLPRVEEIPIAALTVEVGSEGATG
ncbi:hypothetical protein [Leptolyngbya sp. 7M]|uniref:hypothetical protein n=1 Tax=Leptolyngbya sp. 7M TaxID=2812896 RepID=UPI001B8CB4F9|nr:hypothetical protein [Leptolyngbya sp. 7M]QYO64718.1 hypothetical protein JVX88_34825 [Leptolyngbya sp. 7M]